MKWFAVLFLSLLSPLAFAEVAPNFSLRDMNGKQVSLEDYRGQVVLLNFWATWCGPCKVEMPHLQAMYTDFSDKGFVVLAVSTDDARNVSKVKPFIKKNKYTFPVLLDKDSSVLNQYNPEQVLPYNVLIDSNGEVVWKKASYAPGEEVELRHKVESALGLKEEAPKVEEVPSVEGTPKSE
jgi:peroxiredoxin